MNLLSNNFAFFSDISGRCDHYPQNIRLEHDDLYTSRLWGNHVRAALEKLIVSTPRE
jgi:hypothetical protein